MHHGTLRAVEPQESVELVIEEGSEVSRRQTLGLGAQVHPLRYGARLEQEIPIAAFAQTLRLRTDPSHHGEPGGRRQHDDQSDQ